MIFTCNECGKVFKKAAHLGVHSLSHQRKDNNKLNVTHHTELFEAFTNHLLEFKQKRENEKPKLSKNNSEKILPRKLSPPKFIRSFSTPIRIPSRPDHPPPHYLLRKN